VVFVQTMVGERSVAMAMARGKWKMGVEEERDEER
jgi:hypothetical protein